MALIPSFGFGNLFQVIILLVNAVAVLSEDRFLARIGLSASSQDPTFGAAPGQGDSFKAKLIKMIESVRMVARIPLIGVNTLIILYELILG
ncbi:Yos1-like protein [Xylariales sp. PMI_506]|nr:Yos1-like protein [Xylariales sp. PMI_506]